MRLPRDLSGRQLVQALRRLGYEATRQTGSHIRVTTMQHGQHHVSVPDHPVLRVGTLSEVLSDVAEHFAITRDELTEILFGRS